MSNNVVFFPSSAYKQTNYKFIMKTFKQRGEIENFYVLQLRFYKCVKFHGLVEVELVAEFAS